jgi:hypothetical protein
LKQTIANLSLGKPVEVIEERSPRGAFVGQEDIDNWN